MSYGGSHCRLAETGVKVGLTGRGVDSLTGTVLYRRLIPHSRLVFDAVPNIIRDLAEPVLSNFELGLGPLRGKSLLVEVAAVGFHIHRLIA